MELPGEGLGMVYLVDCFVYFLTFSFSYSTFLPYIKLPPILYTPISYVSYIKLPLISYTHFLK